MTPAPVTRSLASLPLVLIFAACYALAPPSWGQSPGPAPRVVIVAPPSRNPYGMLGSFYPDRYLYYGGDVNPSSGYFPLGQWGPNSLSLVGPMANERATAAPVMTYTRGYDGTYWPSVGVSFSYPNMPTIGPVVYPTRATFFYGPRYMKDPPQWPRGTYWIDQN